MRAWLSPAFGPYNIAPVFTNFAGNWTSPAFALPADPNLVGLDVGFQALIFPAFGGAPFVLTNATSSRIGW